MNTRTQIGIVGGIAVACALIVATALLGFTANDSQNADGLQLGLLLCKDSGKEESDTCSRLAGKGIDIGLLLRDNDYYNALNSMIAHRIHGNALTSTEIVKFTLEHVGNKPVKFTVKAFEILERPAQQEQDE